MRFWIHVSPRARRNRVGGVHGGALRVAVTSPPVEGKANQACVRAVARALGLGRSQVTVDPGSRSRRKRVSISADPTPVLSRLGELARSPEEID